MAGESMHSVETADAGPSLYGLLAEFDNPNDLVRATRQAYAAGYRKLDAYSPYPVEEAWEAIPHHSNRVPLAVLCGALAGMCAGFGLQTWASTMYYPMNIGGRPDLSWPSFIPITFELAVLFASFAAVFGMLMMNGLPQPYHPLFNSPRFATASRDRFFLCIEAQDPLFDRQDTLRFLASLEPREVAEVEN